MVGTYVAAALIVGASLLLGQALCALARRPGWPAYGGALGLAGLLAIASLGVALPGRAVTAAVLVAVALGLSGLALTRDRRPLPDWRAGIAVVVVVTLALSVPFIASGRVGILGVSLNNDTSVHLLWAEGLRSQAIAHLYPLPVGYPLGPHALLATVAEVTRIRMDHALTGLLIAVPALLGLTALSALDRLSAPRRVLAGIVVGIAYLPVAWYGQGAFKEIIQGLLLLGFALALRALGQTSGAAAGGWRERARAAFPLGVLAAGSVYTYSYLGLAWLLGGAALWLALELASALAARRSIRNLVGSTAMGGVTAVVVFLVTLAPAIGSVVAYFRAVRLSPSGSGAIATSNLGNLAGPLSPYQALGIWPSSDFRFPPSSGLGIGLLGGLALGVVVYGGLLLIRRRDFALPATALAAGIIFVLSSRGQSPYVAAKALVILAPLATIVGVGAVLDLGAGAWWRSARSFARLAIAFAFIAYAVASSSLALRDSPVGPSQSAQELRTLAQRVGTSPTLFLGNDDYAGWKLRGVRVAYFSTGSYPSPLSVSMRRGKRWEYGQPFDIDNVTARDLDRFRYVIAPNTTYASAMPPNLSPVAATPSFRLWERHGPTAARDTLDRNGEPGAPLNCRTRGGRALAQTGGQAGVMPTPVIKRGVASLGPGARGVVTLALPAGSWDLSASYVNPQPILIGIGGETFRLPARLDRPGPFVSMGVVRSDGRPLRMSVAAEQASWLAKGNQQVGFVSAVAATRHGMSEEVMSLSRACGRYVDWYRPG